MRIKEIKNEDKRIAALYGFGILLVVLGHSAGILPDFQQQLASKNKLYYYFLEFIRWIHTFHMPLFFAISGFLFFKSTLKKDITPKEIIVSKFKRLMIPYIFISSFAYPIKVLLSRFAIRSANFSLIEFINNIIIPRNNTIIFFWFLPTLFFIFIIAAVILKKEHNLSYDFVLLILAGFLWYILLANKCDGILSLFSFGKVLQNFIFFDIGFLMCKYDCIKDKSIDFMGVASLVLSVLLFILLSNLTINAFTKPLFLVLTISGLFFSYWICSLPCKEIFSRIGDFSYQIYLLSWFPQIFVRIMLGQIFFINIWLSVVSSFIFGLTIPMFVTLYLKRKTNKTTQLLFGLQ